MACWSWACNSLCCFLIKWFRGRRSGGWLDDIQTSECLSYILYNIYILYIYKYIWIDCIRCVGSRSLTLVLKIMWSDCILSAQYDMLINSSKYLLRCQVSGDGVTFCLRIVTGGFFTGPAVLFFAANGTLSAKCVLRHKYNVFCR